MLKQHVLNHLEERILDTECKGYLRYTRDQCVEIGRPLFAPWAAVEYNVYVSRTHGTARKHGGPSSEVYHRLALCSLLPFHLISLIRKIPKGGGVLPRYVPLNSVEMLLFGRTVRSESVFNIAHPHCCYVWHWPFIECIVFPLAVWRWWAKRLKKWIPNCLAHSRFCHLLCCQFTDRSEWNYRLCLSDQVKKKAMVVSDVELVCHGLIITEKNGLTEQWAEIGDPSITTTWWS